MLCRERQTVKVKFGRSDFEEEAGYDETTSVKIGLWKQSRDASQFKTLHEIKCFSFSGSSFFEL